MSKEDEEFGLGFYGKLKTCDGEIVTNIVREINGIKFPVLSLALSEDEIIDVLNGKITKEILVKSYRYSLSRIKQGKSPFADKTERISKRKLKKTKLEKYLV